jgi:RNA polymerase sigma-70 factor (ECF subfamily)
VKSNGSVTLPPPAPDETVLVRKAKSGNAEAFGALYDAYVERVYRYIYFRVTDDQTTEDLTSQVFLKAWEHLDRYKPGGSPFIAWLYTIARNAVIDYYRTRKQTVPLEEVGALAVEEEPLDDRMERQFDVYILRTGLQQLTEEQQQVLTLKFMAKLTTEEVARIMGKREGAIRALQMRALQTLAKYMEKEENYA